jgi:hypothetical protein
MGIPEDLEQPDPMNNANLVSGASLLALRRRTNSSAEIWRTVFDPRLTPFHLLTILLSLVAYWSMLRSPSTSPSPEFGRQVEIAN